MKRNILSSVGLGAAALLLLAACAGGDNGATAPAPAPSGDASTGETAAAELTGQILADGSSTVGPLSEAAAELFMAENPGVRVTVGISGTGGGMEKFCEGETDLSGASRLMREDEEERCKNNGIGYDFVTVANDALAVVVNVDNPIQCMTVDELSEFWQNGSTVTTWGASSVDMPADFASTPVTLYGPGTDSGTFDLFTGRINGEAGNINLNYINIGEDDNAAVVGVAGDIGAMSFIPYSYFMENPQVRGLEIDNGNGCFGPTEENLVNEDYRPLGRSLYWYASDVALSRPETVAFFEFVIENNDIIAESVGFIGLTPAQKEVSRAKVAELAG